MAPSTRTDTGRLLDRFPYVRVGDGPKHLLVVPGVGDALFDGTYGRLDARIARRRFEHFLPEYTVTLVSRPRGLAAGTSIRDLAYEYARVLETVGRASVLGLSMGGLITQELGRERPDLIDRLVVGVSGCRLAEESVQTVRRLRWYALEHEWTRIRTELLRAMFTGWRRRVYPRLSSVAGRFRPPTPADPRDVTISVDAVLAYDGTHSLEGIETRTLVIGADEDPFFPEAVLRETQAGLPDAQLAMFTGERHGVFLERKAAFDDWVKRFLEGREVLASRS